jgi:hypothetical protein
MATVKPSAFARRLAEVSMAIVALTGLFEQVAGLLRQVVHVIGWLVLVLVPSACYSSRICQLTI